MAAAWRRCRGWRRLLPFIAVRHLGLQGTDGYLSASVPQWGMWLSSTGVSAWARTPKNQGEARSFRGRSLSGGGAWERWLPLGLEWRRAPAGQCRSWVRARCWANWLDWARGRGEGELGWARVRWAG
jgi:hypothetical protein